MSLFLELPSKGENSETIIIDLERAFFYRKKDSSDIPDCQYSIEVWLDNSEVVTMDYADIENRDKVYNKIREALVIQI